MNPVAQLRHVQDGDDTYDAIVIWCPGCEYEDPRDPGHMVGGLHWLPVNGPGARIPKTEKRPVWVWNGDLVSVGLEPSILTQTTRGPEETPFVCHCFLRNGIWQFLGDCTHELVNQHVPMLPLPDWALK